MKLRKFKLHFNRINMQRKKSTVWTVHTSSACFQVEQVKCYVPLETIFKADGPQPRAYLSGLAEIRVHKKIAYLVDEDSFEHMDDDTYFDIPKD